MEEEAGDAAAAERAYDQILQLERNLLAASKAKGAFDPAVRRLRTSIRDSYEALILRDLALCESFEVEQALWRLHYREIEGFRVRVRKILTEKPPADNILGQRGKKKKKGNRQEPLLRALTSFKSFLGEASGFFHGLLIKLRLHHGLASSIGNMDRIAAEGLTDGLRRCMVVCHRIMIYLGDLARYRELYAVMDSSARDWSVAANYYKQAAFLWPASGNPYNQLAVLCTYCGNNLTALYQYCRSLAVSVPFATAWDNVTLLFEKNKQQLTQASLLRSPDNSKSCYEMTLPTNLHGFVIEQDLWSITRTASSRGIFVLHFVKLVGILLTQSSTDELDEVADLIKRDFRRFLHAECKLINQTKASQKAAGSTSVALQVIVILIFCMHSICGLWTTTSQEYLVTSLNVMFKFGATLLEVAEKLEEWSAFPVIVILMEWLASQPKALQVIEKDKSLTKSFTILFEKVSAFDTFVMSSINVEKDASLSEAGEGSHLKASGKAQWEDHELLGFVPLAPVHLNLDFSNQLPGYGVCDFSTYLCWKLRCTAALQKAGGALESNVAGHHFVPLSETCQLEAEGSSLLVLQPTGGQQTVCPSAKLPHAGHDAPAVEDTTPSMAANPTASLKEWIEKTYFSVQLSSDLNDKNRQHVVCQVDPSMHDGTGGKPDVSNTAEACSQMNGKVQTSVLVQPTEAEVEGFEGNMETHIIPLLTGTTANVSSPTRTESVSFKNASIKASDVISRGTKEQSGSNCRESSPAYDAGCGSPCSSLFLRNTKGQRMESKGWKFGAENRSKRGHMVIASRIEKFSDNCAALLDAQTHAKPRSLWLGSSHKRTISSLYYNRTFVCTSDSCESQNPFVLRLKKCADETER